METLLHHGANHRVFRALSSTGETVIVKRAREDGDGCGPAPGLANEQRILARLQGVAACPRLLRADASELVMDDVGGIAWSASGRLGRSDLDGFLILAEALASGLAAIHARGVIHRDLHPDNLLILPDARGVRIIDYDLATTFAEEHPDFAPRGPMVGTLAFAAPEQTGRMNRPVDYRADLYAAGATLYALATGVPPFDDADPLVLLHAHLARLPRPPRERAPWLPEHLSTLVLTLLAKEPDDRYQSAAGLAHDLQQYRRALRQGRPLGTIRPRLHDLPLVPRPPRRLYGRTRELDSLLTAFAEVGAGATGALFVTGYSGVGKTALIHELHRPVTLRRGLFIGGKCEQFQRDRPLLAPACALRQLCQLLLADAGDWGTPWPERLRAGLGPDAGALCEVVPELTALLGPLPPVSALGPLEAQGRLRALLVALMRQVAAPAHPLVLFLDDLQWADPPTLDFIGALLDEPRLPGFLLIGAYRDHEVEAAHPLRRLLHRPTAAGAPPTQLALDSLPLADLETLLADMLCSPTAEVRPLAEALFARTRGNPFFTVELLQQLRQREILRPDPQEGRWRWDLKAILASPVSANVVDILRAQLSGLPPESLEALVAAAALGNASELGTLALATAIPPHALVQRLAPALEQGILFTPDALACQRAETTVPLRFCHDRMQQAAYQLWDPARRESLHLAMARRFASADATAPERRFSAAEHYARAVPLIVAAEERASACQYFLDAAVQARQAGAFEATERFARLGLGLLSAPADRPGAGPAAEPDLARPCRPEASVRLRAELHGALYSQSRHDEADAIFAVLADTAPDPVALVASVCVQIASLSNRTRYVEAVSLSAAHLARLGILLPVETLSQALADEIDALYRHAAAGDLERLADSPELRDARLLGAATLLNRMIPAAFFAQPMLALWCALRVLRLAIEHGFCVAMLYPASSVIVGTVAFRDDYATGERVARMALAAGQAREGALETARVQQQFGLLGSHWFHPLGEDITWARRAFDSFLRGGDPEIGCFTFFTTQAALLDTCEQLAEMAAENAAALAFAHKTGNRHAEQSYLSYRQLVRALEGQTARPGSFDDAEFDETAHTEAIRANGMARCYFHLHRGLSAALFADATALLAHAGPALRLAPYIACFYPTALAHLLRALALLIRLREAPPATSRIAWLDELSAHQTWLERRAADAPMNFGHLHDLIAAERLDLLGEHWLALQTFERAMRAAQGHRRPWHQALITEHAGRFHMRHGQDHAGRALLGRAHLLYQHWGATGKTQAMREELAFLDPPPARSSSDRHAATLDRAAWLRASQALAGETLLPQLVEQVMALVTQLTGATHAWLLVMEPDGQWQLAGGLCGTQPLESMPLVAAEEQRLVAGSVLRLGLSTRVPVVSDDAVSDIRFQADPYFGGLNLCALLALPVMVQTRVSAFLGLEHRLLRAAFTTERIEMVAMLCGHLAMSIENVRLAASIARQEARSQRQALLDQLTGIANRAGFEQRLREFAQACDGRPDDGFALVLVDLNGFKRINHGFGLAAGDTVLKTTAERLVASLKGSDLVARLDADRFALALSGLQRGQDVERVAKRLLAALSQPYTFAGTTVIVRACLGLAVYPRDAGGDVAMLWRNAELALDQIKAEGSDGVRLFDPVLAAAVEYRHRLDKGLREAMRERHLLLFYQPIVDLRDRRVVGAEALIRWRHPERGLVPPDTFIPFAEETGLIAEIGLWVLETAVEQLAAWQARGWDLSLSLNVSARQIPDGLTPRQLAATAERHGVAPKTVALEITEGVFVDDIGSARNWLTAVRAAGFRVFLDDFGTGYSSLSYLKHFPVDRIKIDKSFVRDMARDASDYALVEAMIAIGRALDIPVVAEGVETQEQARLLLDMGCRSAQGYYFSPPVPAERFAPPSVLYGN